MSRTNLNRLSAARIAVLTAATVCILGVSGCGGMPSAGGGAGSGVAAGTWGDADRIAQQGKTFSVTAKFADNKNRYKLGEPIRMEIVSAQGGRLWLLQITANGKVEQLFPNAGYRDNVLTAGRVMPLPPTGVKWEFAAGEPLGPSRVLAIVTTGSTTLKDVVASENGLRLLAQPDGRWSAAQLTMDVTR
jgi:hypothetical protein